MSPEKEKVDAAFVQIAARHGAEGLDALTAAEKAILHIYHSIGLIENGGLGRYLFVIDDLFPIDEVINELFDLGLGEVALAINRGAMLLLNYLRGQSISDPPDFEGFERAHHAELTRLQNEICASEPQVVDALHGLLNKLGNGEWEKGV